MDIIKKLELYESRTGVGITRKLEKKKFSIFKDIRSIKATAEKLAKNTMTAQEKKALTDDIDDAEDKIADILERIDAIMDFMFDNKPSPVKNK